MLRIAEAAGEILLLIPNLSVLGFLELSLGRPAEADEHLSRAVELERAMGVSEPAYFRVVPDEVEALVALGRLGLSDGSFGLLMACVGGGAIGGALVRPLLRRRLSFDRLIALASLGLAAGRVGLAYQPAPERVARARRPPLAGRGAG